MLDKIFHSKSTVTVVAAVGMVLGVGIILGVGVGALMRSDKPLVTAAATAPPPPSRTPIITIAPEVREDAARNGPLRVPQPDSARPEAAPPAAPIDEPAPPVQTAMVMPPAPAPVVGVAGEPAWRRFAVAAPATAGRPTIVVVIDDMGVDRKRSDRAVALPGPLTTAWLPYADDLHRQTAAAHAHGHELLVHVPMEPMDPDYDAGPQSLQVHLGADEVRQRLEWDLGRFEGYVGINNHMGSRFSADPAGMAVVMAVLRQHGLLFLDSKTSEKSVGEAFARKAGLPTVSRDVFLDNEPDVASVRQQLARVEELARKHGHAVAIGHPRDGTIEALQDWLPTVAKKGFVLVPLTAILR